MKRFIPILVTGVILFLAGVIIFQFASPRLLSMEPKNGSVGIHPKANLRLTFSRQMNHDAVLDHLRFTPPIDGDFSWEGKTLIFTPEGGWPSGVQIQVEFTAGATASGLLPLSIRQSFEGSFQVNQPRLAYLYPSTGPANLYVIQPESGEVDLLVDFPEGILDYESNWAGSTIYFSGRNAAGGSDIYQLSTLHQEPPVDEQVIENEDENRSPAYQLVLPCQANECRAPALSPSGQYLAFEQTIPLTEGGSGYPQVMLLPLSGNGLPSGDPFPVGDADHQTTQPSWSSRGWLSFYDSTVIEFIFIDPESGEIARLPNESGENGSWSPDGSVFVVPEYYYLDDTLPGGGEVIGPVVNSRLIAFYPEDGRTEDLSGAQNIEDMVPSFSPDGYNLAFARRYLGIAQWTPGRQLWMMPFAGNAPAGDPFPISNDPYYTHYDFVWSPDSNRLAYIRFNQTTLTEPPEIWFLEPLNLEGEKLIIGGTLPQWIP